MTTTVSAAAATAREQHRDLRGRFGAQPASESHVELQPELTPVTVPTAPGCVTGYAALSGWDADQADSLYERSVARAARRKLPAESVLARDWSSFCRDRARRCPDGDLAAEYAAMAGSPPAAREAMAIMGMNQAEHAATASMRALTASISAVRGASRRDVDDYLAAARAQYTSELAHLPEGLRPDPPAEFVRGLTERCWQTNRGPHDPATLYALYRADSDPGAFPSRSRSFASIDLETAGPDGRDGFKPEHGCIIEVGTIRLDESGAETGRFQRMVRPSPRAQATFGTGAVHIHGITMDDVKDAPTWDEVAPGVLASVDRATLIAHNAAFESQWLGYHLEGFNPDTPAVDTLHVAQRHFGDLKDHRLQTVCEHLEVDYSDGHRAAHDAEVAGRAYFAARATIEDRYVADPRFAALPDPRG